jgi:hypothetical protein
MGEVFDGVKPTADHKYFVVWSNNSVTLKSGFASEPAARHHAREIRRNDIGTVHSVTGPEGPVEWQITPTPPAQAMGE